MLLSAYQAIRTDQMLSYITRHLSGRTCFCAKQSFPNEHRSTVFAAGHNVIQRRHKSRGSHKKFKHQKKDLYEILELSQKATSVQIKGAYFRLSKKYHPDINKSEDAAVKFAEIAEAYEILGKTHSRSLYDKGLIDEDDMRNTGHPDGWKAYRKGFKKYDGPPMRGRTSIYNFDEWTRNHYAETFAKRNAEKEKYDAYHIEKQEMEVRGEWKHDSWDQAALIAFVIITGTLVALVSSHKSEIDLENRRLEAQVFIEKELLKREDDTKYRLETSKDLETNLATD